MITLNLWLEASLICCICYRIIELIPICHTFEYLTSADENECKIMLSKERASYNVIFSKWLLENNFQSQTAI